MYLEHDNYSWLNWPHCQGPLRVDRMYEPINSPGPGTTASDAYWLDGLRSLKDILTKESGREVQARGEDWSYSAAGVTTSVMVNMTYLNAILPDIPTEMLARPDGPPLLHVQAGCAVHKVIIALLNRGATLRSMGGNCGQTIYGAIATGTHGAFYHEQAIADVVRALHIVKDNGEEAWVERHTTPLTNVDCISLLPNALVRRDDALFNAALVSLGCFGLVHSLVIEGRSRYWLSQTHVKVPGASEDTDPTNQTLAAIAAKDLAALGFRGNVKRHVYLECVVNPYSGSAYITHGEEVNDRPAPWPGHGPGFSPEDWRSCLARIGISLAPLQVAQQIETLLDGQYGVNNAQSTLGPFGGSLLDCFPRGAPDIQRQIRSMEICVDSSQLLDVVTAIVTFMRDELDNNRVFPGAFSVRRCRQTAATLGFTRFPESCTIELPALDYGGINAWYDDIIALLNGGKQKYRVEARVTQHPGQIVRLTAQTLRSTWGGDAVDGWVSSRRAFLSATGAAMFRNRLAMSLGLV